MFKRNATLLLGVFALTVATALSQQEEPAEELVTEQ